MLRCFKVTGVESSKNKFKGKTRQEYDFSNITNAVGIVNQGLSLSSPDDLSGVVLECEDDGHKVTSDSTWVKIPRLGIRHKKDILQCALRQYYNTKVQLRRKMFHEVMSQIEHKVNDILSYVESSNTDFRFRRMSPASYYEIRAHNEIDIHLVLESFSPIDVTVEEIGDPQGCARIRIPVSSSLSSECKEIRNVPNSCLVKDMPDSQYLSARSVGGKFKDLVQRCFEELPSSWRQAYPRCKLNHQAYRVGNKNLTKGRSNVKNVKVPKNVSFERITDTDVVGEICSTVINLIPVIEFPSLWPLCSNWLKSTPLVWPDPTTLKTITDQGVHLVAMPTDKDAQDLWVIKFLNAHRCLISQEGNDVKRKCLQLVKVFCENEVGFTSSFLPIHLEHIFIQQSRQEPSKELWVEENMTHKFLEILLSLYDCLVKRNCPSFFIPELNLFAGMSAGVSQQLSRRVLHIITDPIKYLVK